MDDVFEIRSESKASFPHKPFTLSVSPTNKQFNDSKQHIRSQSLSVAKHKKLPSINNSSEFPVLENKSTKVADEKPTKKLLTTELGLNSSSTHFDEFLNREVSAISSSSTTLPRGIVKKNPPKKIAALNHTVESQNFNYRKLNMQNLDTAVTIDILNESDRFSRQSLEPLTNRESTSSRFSSRPSSVKEPLFRKSSGIQNLITTKLHKQSIDNPQAHKMNKSSRKPSSTIDLTSEFDLKINELTNEASIRQEILASMNSHEEDCNNEQDLSEYDDYLKELENEELPQRPAKSNEKASESDEPFKSTLEKSGKLDTIDESSLTEVMQLNIKKLQLNKKNEESKSTEVKKAQGNIIKNNQTNLKKTAVISNNSKSAAQISNLKSQGKLVNETSPSTSEILNNSNNNSIKNNTSMNATNASRTTVKSGIKTYAETDRKISNLKVNNSMIKIRDTSPSSSSSVEKTKSSKGPPSVANRPPQGSEKSLNLDLFNPTCSNPPKKPSDSNIRPGQKPPKQPSKKTLTNRSSSSISLTNKTPNTVKPSQTEAKQEKIKIQNTTSSNQMEGIKVEKTKKLPSNVKQQTNQTSANTVPNLTISTSNIDKIAENKEPKKADSNSSEAAPTVATSSVDKAEKLEVTTGSILLHERPKSGNGNATSQPLTTAHSTAVIAQAVELAQAQKVLADAAEAAKPAPPLPSQPPNHSKQTKTLSSLPEEPNKRLLSATKIVNLDLNNLEQPVIYDMFQDYPQPFTSNDITNSGSLATPAKKKKKVTYKKRTTSSGKPLTSSTKSKTKGREASSQYESVIDNLKVKFLKENEKCIPEDNGGESLSDVDMTETDLALSTATIKLGNDKSKADSADPNELSIKLKSDLVKAVAEKVDLIYNKFNNLLLQQEKIIESSSKENLDEKARALNEHKANFSIEMANELEKNIDFGEFGDVSSNPELIKQLQQVYVQLKKNAPSAEKKNESGEVNKSVSAGSKKKEVSGSKNESAAGNRASPEDKTSERIEIVELPVTKKFTKFDKFNSSNMSINDNSFTILKEKKPLKRNDSLRSNADIREVFSIVNTMSKTNSINSQNCELTFPPIANRVKMANSFNHISLLYNKSRLIPKLPDKLSDKINTLIVPIDNEAQKFSNSGDEEDKEDDDDDDIITMTNRSHNTNESLSDNRAKSALNITKDSVNEKRLKNIRTHQLDSIGNESYNSLPFDYDANSLNHQYDVKYRNDGSNIKMGFLNEDDNDFQYKWKRGNLLGKGAFGSVYQAMLSTGAIIAVKQIEMEESDPNKARKAYDSVREEVKILRELDHMNTVQFMGTMLEGSVVNIFMELIPGGTIETLLKTYGPFEEDLFKNFTTQIIEGINYIHSKNVVHRDIKGKNIMLMGNGVIKLIDFGCAKRLKKNQSSNSIKQLLKSLKGTPYWMSPEVIKEVGHGSKADIWSTGCTIFEMATGLPPWGELQPIAAIYAIGSGDTSAPELPQKFTEEARDFVSRCLVRDPDQRPSAAQLLEHEFLKTVE